MARITVEDCLKKVDNRFGLIHLAAKRVRQLRRGAEPLFVCKNKDIVVALREIAAEQVYQVRGGGAENAAQLQGEDTQIQIPEYSDEDDLKAQETEQEDTGE